MAVSTMRLAISFTQTDTVCRPSLWWHVPQAGANAMRHLPLFTGIGGLTEWRDAATLLYMPRGSKPKQYPPDLVQRVSDLYAANNTQHEIAAILGLTQKVIWNLMRRHGLPRRVAAKREQRGNQNATWKGRAVGYAAKHCRVAAARGKPRLCEWCGQTDIARSYDWACISGDYDDIAGFVRLCRSCHWKHDNKARNLGAYAVKGGSR